MQREVRYPLFYAAWIVLALLVSGFAHSEETEQAPEGSRVYKQVNPDGTITYTDKPAAADSKEMKVPKGTEYTPPKLPPFTPSKPDSAPEVFRYDSLTIQSPKDDESIWDNTGNITVTVSHEPYLQAGHQIEFLLDGQSVSKGRAARHQFLNVDRGTHQIMARIVDSSDQVIVSTSVTIHMKRHAIP